SRPRLTIKQILAWADAHHERTGECPNTRSGTVHEAPTEQWANIAGYLSAGVRGLPGGSTLRRLLAEKRGISEKWRRRPRLTIDQILAWADEHHSRTGRWPKRRSGPVYGVPNETWRGITDSLHEGFRGLEGGMSLPRLLWEKRGVPYKGAMPRLRIDEIREWAIQHRTETGEWPTRKSGPVSGTKTEKLEGDRRCSESG
ncbi:MAG: hypothetical protein ACYS8X_14635, partial [Planctomycetota bacterium]